MKKPFVYNSEPYRDEVKETVMQEIKDVLGLFEGEVTDTANMYYDLGADSLDIIEITMNIEKDFGISIPDKELFPGDFPDGTKLSEKDFTVDYCVKVVRKYINNSNKKGRD